MVIPKDGMAGPLFYLMLEIKEDIYRNPSITCNPRDWRAGPCQLTDMSIHLPPLYCTIADVFHDPELQQNTYINM